MRHRTVLILLVILLPFELVLSFVAAFFAGLAMRYFSLKQRVLDHALDLPKSVKRNEYGFPVGCDYE